MSQLLDEKTKISRNLENLQLINESLDARLQSLSADPDTISMYAHELGYVADGERLIKLAGFSGGIDRTFETGQAKSVAQPLFVSEWICKFFGILIGIVSFAYLMIVSMRKKNGHQKA